MAAAAAPAAGQAAAQPAAPAVSQVGLPDELTIHKLVWSAMAAIDQANQTGNYSVLRDLGAPSFQAKNNSATLGTIFQGLRTQQIDIGYTLVMTPVFQFPPAMVAGGLLRIRGVFPMRPTAVGFDLLYQNVDGQWRIFGIAVVPVVARVPQSGSTRR